MILLPLTYKHAFLLYSGLLALPLKSISHHLAMSDICISAIFEQPENAELPIEVTLLGIVIEVRDLQPLNA